MAKSLGSAALPLPPAAQPAHRSKKEGVGENVAPRLDNPQLSKGFALLSIGTCLDIASFSPASRPHHTTPGQTRPNQTKKAEMGKHGCRVLCIFTPGSACGAVFPPFSLLFSVAVPAAPHFPHFLYLFHIFIGGRCRTGRPGRCRAVPRAGFGSGGQNLN
eukprot:gene16220-biopygen2229